MMTRTTLTRLGSSIGVLAAAMIAPSGVAAQDYVPDIEVLDDAEVRALPSDLRDAPVTVRTMDENGVETKPINKALEGRPHIVDAMKNGDVDIVFNTTEGTKALEDSKSIRQTALLYHIPYYTTIAGIGAVARAICALNEDNLTVTPIQDYMSHASCD